MASVSVRYRRDHYEQKRCEALQSENCESSRWFSLLHEWRAYHGRELLEQINAAVNSLDYRADTSNYDRADYWATPQELLENGGDCEDFAVAKMLALEHAGIPAKSMRVVVVQDTATTQPHAVLAVSLGHETLILDNKTNALFSDNQLPHYTPLYSINEQQWWLHMPVEVAERLFVQVASTTGTTEQMSGAIVSR